MVNPNNNQLMKLNGIPPLLCFLRCCVDHILHIYFSVVWMNFKWIECVQWFISLLLLFLLTFSFRCVWCPYYLPISIYNDQLDSNQFSSMALKVRRFSVGIFLRHFYAKFEVVPSRDVTERLNQWGASSHPMRSGRCGRRRWFGDPFRCYRNHKIIIIITMKMRMVLIFVV